MDPQPIKNISSLKKMRDDAKNFTAFKKAWPLLRPFFKLLGADVKKLDEALKQIDHLAVQTEELTSMPDDFNDLFADKGWIMYSRMNNDLAKKAIDLGKSGHFDEAERVLIEFYSPEKIANELKTMIAVEAFRSRMPLAEKALADFKEGRYYATVLVVLSLLDGMVNEIQQKGFFTQGVDLTAWDSVAAHSKGLQRLTSILSQSRKKTRTGSLTLPYRHGIVHGMDLGYDNQMVAVKSWVALFATRDWAVMAERNQLEAPPPKPEKTWKELFQQIQDLERDKKALSSWKPRNIEVGTNIPPFGEPTDYDSDSPEQKFAEFLHYWQANNYGYMAKCIATHMGHPTKELPMRVREEYSGKQLKSWEFRKIEDEAPAITVISVYVAYEENGLTNTKLVEARLICEDDHDFGVMHGKPGSRWSLVTWYLRARNSE
jgi:hypothetical protein